MRRDMNDDIEVARNASARRTLAFAGESDLVALVDSGRDGDAQLALAFDTALAMTRMARRLDDLARAVAAVARDDVHDLAEHRRADGANLARALTARAGDGIRARLGARSSTRLATRQRRELDFLFDAADRLGERDLEVIAEVCASRDTRSTSATRGTAEERVEDVAEALK